MTAAIDANAGWRLIEHKQRLSGLTIRASRKMNSKMHHVVWCQADARLLWEVYLTDADGETHSELSVPKMHTLHIPDEPPQYLIDIQNDPRIAPNRSCETCRYGVDGECHRHSPTVGTVLWPCIHADDWCGDWQRG